MRRTIYFASGCTHEGEVHGFAAIGQPIGVAAHQCSTKTQAALVSLAGTGLPIFVDSGAFSEVHFPNGKPEVKVAITDDGWARRLGLYRHLATSGLADQLCVVAPDRVGDQMYTIELLSQYAGALRDLAGLGCEVLVPLQCGDAEQSLLHRMVDTFLGCPWTPALPSKHAATSTDEVARYARACQPHRVHLLGLGKHNRRLPEVLDAIWGNSPDTEVVLHDSFLIRSKCGRTNGPGGGPRAYTAAMDRIAAEMEANGWGRRGASYAFTSELKRRAVIEVFG